MLRGLIKLHCNDYVRLSNQLHSKAGLALAWPAGFSETFPVVFVIPCFDMAWMASEKCRRWATSSHAYVMRRLDEATDITLRSFESQRKEA